MLRRSNLFRFAPTTTLLGAAEGTPAFKTLKDVVAVTSLQPQGKTPLHQLISKLTPLSKDVIFKSGTGVEGFLKLHPDVVEVVVDGGVKVVQVAETPEAANYRTSITAQRSAPAAQEAVTDSSSSQEGSPTSSGNAGDLCFNTLPETHPAYRLIKRVRDITPVEDGWYNINEVYNVVYCTDESKQSVKHKDFLAFLKSMPNIFWSTKAFFKFRKVGETTMPPVDNMLTLKKKGGVQAAQPQQQQQQAAPAAGNGMKTMKPSLSHSIVPNQSNNFGGWGSMANIPTSEDVFEILKFIPIQWANMGNLGLPQDKRKKHIRVSSFLQWLRRQPKYFEVRNLAGTIEVRRSIILHPDAHGMTKEQAEELVAKRLEEGIHNNIAATPGGGESGSVGSTASVAQGVVHKFLARVCPGYYVPMDLILSRRATKKAMSGEDLWRVAAESPDIFEEITLRDNTTKLLRRRIGYDSSNWGKAFIDDVHAEEKDELLPVLCNVMAKAPAAWDRLEYLYVRLSDEDKITLEGYQGMVDMLKRHPTIFKVGEYFYKRIDSSDPNAAEEAEPESNDSLQAKQLEENPYLTPKELADVFHYLTPEDTPVTTAYFVEASSPAMRVVLPPRLISLLQTFPDLFLCKETSPGMFSVERRKEVTAASAEEAAGGMKPDETIEAVSALIPVRGVDIAQLQVWMSLPLKNAVNAHFQTLLELLRQNPTKFHIVENPPYTMIYKQRTG